MVEEILVPLALGVSSWGLGQLGPLGLAAPALAASSGYSTVPCGFHNFLHASQWAKG